MADPVQEINTFIEDVDKIHTFTNGADNQTVDVIGGTIPTLRKWLKDWDEVIQDQITEELNVFPTLAANTGAGKIGTTGGITVQQSLTALAATDADLASDIIDLNTNISAALAAKVAFSDLAADTGTTLVVNKSTATGSLARTVRSVLDDSISVLNFAGVDRTGVADSTAGILNAAASVAAGTKIFFPPGLYRYTSLNNANPVTFAGAGPANSLLMCSATTGDTITLNNASRLQDLGITYQGTPTTGCAVRILGNYSGIENCEFTNYFIGVIQGTLATRSIFPYVIGCNFRAPKIAAGSGAIWLQNFGNAVIDRCVASGPNLPAVQPDFGIRVHNGDTAFFTNVNVTLHGLALDTSVPAGLNCYALYMENCFFDSARTTTSEAVVPSGRMRPAGNLINTKATNCWFGLSQTGSGLDISATGAGTVNGLTFVNCDFMANTDAGVAILSTACTNVDISASQAAGNVVYGFRVAPNVGNFKLTNNRSGNIGGRGPNGRGMNIDAGTSDNYLVTGNINRGNTTFNFFDGGSGVNKVVANNLNT